jgi:hypothetical protein
LQLPYGKRQVVGVSHGHVPGRIPLLIFIEASKRPLTAQTLPAMDIEHAQLARNHNTADQPFFWSDGRPSTSVSEELVVSDNDGTSTDSNIDRIVVVAASSALM